MLRALIAKDLRRVMRNPLPWLLNLALPLCITAVIGLAFGGGGENNQLGKIKFAVVDEDDGAVSKFFRGAADQGDAAKYLEPVFLERDAAMQQLNDSKLSAALIIPEHFTSNYLTGQDVRLELIKNPAEQIHPAVLEELLGAAVSALNAVSRNFAGEFPAWRRVADGTADYHEISSLIDEEGNKAHALRHYLFPPLIGYTNLSGSTAPTNAAAAPADGKPKGGASSAEKPAPKFNLFGYLLIGMATMFLMMLANQGVNDFHRELALRTFERYNTLRERLAPFVAGKALFAIVVVMLGAAILLGGGGLVFHIDWQRPLELTALTLAYVCFAVGLMAAMVAIQPDERRANALNNVVSMVLTMAGGGMFPPEQLPAIMRERLMPLLPTYWYVDTARHLWWSEANWPLAAAKLFALGALGLAAAAFLMRRRLRTGAR